MENDKPLQGTDTGLYLSLLSSLMDAGDGIHLKRLEDRTDRINKIRDLLLVDAAHPPDLSHADREDLDFLMDSDEALREILSRRLYFQIVVAIAENRPIEDVMRLVSRFRRSVHLRNYYGTTPLHVAALHGRSDIVRELLRSGADPLAINAEGETPLHCAVKGRKKQTADVLLENTDPTVALEILLNDQQTEQTFFQQQIREMVQKLVDIPTGLRKTIDRAVAKKKWLANIFLPVYARLGLRKKVRMLARGGAQVSTDLLSEQMSRLVMEQSRKNRQKTQRQGEVFPPHIVQKESQVAGLLHLYDINELGLGAPPMIRVPVLQTETLSTAEEEFIRQHRIGLYRQYREAGNRQDIVARVRKDIPVVDAYVAVGETESLRDSTGKPSRPIHSDEEVPQSVQNDYRTRKDWHDTLLNARTNMSDTEYDDFLSDLRASLDRDQAERPGLAFPTRVTDDAELVERRRVFAEEIRAVIQDMYGRLQKNTTVFAVDTINVLRARDPGLRVTDYTDIRFQEIFDASFNRHREGIAGVLGEGGDRTTVVWVCPRVGQQQDLVVQSLVQGGNHREVMVRFAVRIEDLRFTRSLDDFFLLCLVAFYKRSEVLKIRNTRLVVVSNDKFRDWSDSPAEYNAAEEVDEKEWRIQKKAVKKAARRLKKIYHEP